MFSKNLSISILQLCSSRNLTYEEAAERWDLRPRYFGSIAGGQTNVSLSTLEKLCKGFELTPNELLNTAAVGLQCAYGFYLRTRLLSRVPLLQPDP